MDIEIIIRKVIQAHDGDHTAPATTLGYLIAEALQEVGVGVGDDQIADYVRDLGDRTALATTEISVRLAEDIEQDLDEDEL